MRERWRLVTIQNGKRHVSSVVLTQAEAEAQVRNETLLHELTGWQVEPRLPEEFTALSGGVLRTVRAECFDAMADDGPHTDTLS